jgi:hypothetical protein
MTVSNALNMASAGIPVMSTAGLYTATTTTNHNLLVGAASNAITNVAPSATSGVPVISQGASADPAFGTAVVAGGGTGVTTMTTAYAPVCAGTTATGNLQVASTGLSTSGYVLTSNGASALPSFQVVPAGMTWVTESTTSRALTANQAVICTNASLTTCTLPATAAVGDLFLLVAAGGAAVCKLAQNAGQKVNWISTPTTTGTGGSITSISQFTFLQVVCTTANTTFMTLDSSGSWTVV